MTPSVKDPSNPEGLGSIEDVSQRNASGARGLPPTATEQVCQGIFYRTSLGSSSLNHYYVPLLSMGFSDEGISSLLKCRFEIFKRHSGETHRGFLTIFSITVGVNSGYLLPFQTSANSVEYFCLEVTLQIT